MTALPVAFRLDLAHGRCVGLPVPDVVDDTWLARLDPAERAHAESLPPLRRPTWVTGRLALRAALADAGHHVGAILNTERGGPALPEYAPGSISHKRHLAVALAGTYVGPATGPFSYTVGIDVEMNAAPRTDIGRRVLTPAERAAVAALAPADQGRAVMLRFSAKEALYKALDPYVRRYVGFQEVTVEPAPDGGAIVALDLRHGEGPFAAEVRWLTMDGHILTTARVNRVGTTTVSPSGEKDAAV